MSLDVHTRPVAAEVMDGAPAAPEARTHAPGAPNGPTLDAGRIHGTLDRHNSWTVLGSTPDLRGAHHESSSSAWTGGDPMAARDRHDRSSGRRDATVGRPLELLIKLRAENAGCGP